MAEIDGTLPSLGTSLALAAAAGDPKRFGGRALAPPAPGAVYAGSFAGGLCRGVRGCAYFTLLREPVMHVRK